MVNEFLFYASIIIVDFCWKKPWNEHNAIFVGIPFSFHINTLRDKFCYQKSYSSRKIIDWKAETSKEKVQNQFKQINRVLLSKVTVNLYKEFDKVKYKLELL